MSHRMSSSVVRTAVIGVGHLGRFHAQKHKLIDGVEFVGVCDVSKEQAEKVAAELGVKAFIDPKQLLGKVDAVTVAASTDSHFEICKMFLENGVHVLVEKPITTTVVQGEELCQIAEKKNLKLQVGHVERFNPALIAVREKLGKPLFIECHRLAPFKVRSTEVDVVLDLMIHDLDVILSLVRSKPVSVSAVGTPVLTKKLDICNARIEFESGAVANVTASRVSQNTQRKFRVFQANQYLSIDFQSGEVNLLTKTGEWTGEELPLDHDSFNLEKGDALLEETKSFVNCIRQDQPVLVSGRDGLSALQLAEQIVANAESRLK